MNLNERRAWLEKKVGPIPDPMWEALVQSRHAKVGEMDDEEEEILEDRARFGLLMRRRNVRDFDSGLRNRHSHSFFMDSHQARRHVLAGTTAVAAAEHPEVLAFRAEVLGESFPLTYKGALRYVNEEGDVREGAPHAQRLKDLTKILAETCVWRTDDASWFVLTGNYVPPIALPTVESRITRTKGGPKIGIITLTVEPWLPADKVLAMYRKAQRQMLGQKPHQVSRRRLRLLEFVEAWGEGLSWRECMDLWNGDHPEEQYTDPRNFRKACNEIQELVLEPRYHPLQKDQEVARKRRREYIKRSITQGESFRRFMEHIDREIEREQRFIERQEARKGEDY